VPDRNEKLDSCSTVPLIRGESRKKSGCGLVAGWRGHMRVVERSRQRIGAVTCRRPDFMKAADALFL